MKVSRRFGGTYRDFYVCCLIHAGFVLSLFFDPEDGDDVLVETSFAFHEASRLYITEEKLFISDVAPAMAAIVILRSRNFKRTK
jgi:hypothetical protein